MLMDFFSISIFFTVQKENLPVFEWKVIENDKKVKTTIQYEFQKQNKIFCQNRYFDFSNRIFPEIFLWRPPSFFMIMDSTCHALHF